MSGAVTAATHWRSRRFTGTFESVRGWVINNLKSLCLAAAVVSGLISRLPGVLGGPKRAQKNRNNCYVLVIDRFKDKDIKMGQIKRGGKVAKVLKL